METARIECATESALELIDFCQRVVQAIPQKYVFDRLESSYSETPEKFDDAVRRHRQDKTAYFHSDEGLSEEFFPLDEDTPMELLYAVESLHTLYTAIYPHPANLRHPNHLMDEEERAYFRLFSSKSPGRWYVLNSGISGAITMPTGIEAVEWWAQQIGTYTHYTYAGIHNGTWSDRDIKGLLENCKSLTIEFGDCVCATMNVPMLREIVAREGFRAKVASQQLPVPWLAGNSENEWLTNPSPAVDIAGDIKAVVPEHQWSDYRQPKQWRNLREKAGLASRETNWRKQRRAHPSEIQGEPGNELKSCRLTRNLAEQWGLRLPEFNHQPASLPAANPP